MKTLTDRTALVTGAASGIGRATARALATRGCRLAIADVCAEPLAALAAELNMGPRLSLHVADVSKRDDWRRLADEALAAHGEVLRLVNTAGVTVAKSFFDHTAEDLEWVLGVNLMGVMYGCHTLLPHMIKNSVGEGHIVNISSIFGVIGVPSQTSYCASKFGVRGFTEALQEELRGTPVSATVVHPGGISTRIMHNARADDAELQRSLERFFERKTLPPEAVAEAIIAAVLANKPRVLVTREAYALDTLKRLFPVWGNALGVRTLLKAMRMGPALEAARARVLAGAPARAAE